MIETVNRRGLCGNCKHARVIRSSKGSEFTLCERSKTDGRYRKYPQLPVVHCAGHEPLTPAAPSR
ncbi:MAG TPA: hypothetical protein VL137_13570 [Polyangiaceae bacterium]|nr:hypothetical protein [Polyangiaceae bacterium]